MIKAEVIADSYNSYTDRRVTTFLVTFHRYILPEVLTHRTMSRNTSSSRAKPLMQTIKDVWNNPAVPIRFGKAKKGMQDDGPLSNTKSFICGWLWKLLRFPAIFVVWILLKLGLHKQFANRLLEPWIWTTMVITASEWKNFYTLRNHKDAQPEIQELSRCMLKAHSESVPKELKLEEWHLPFIKSNEQRKDIDLLIKKSVARCARTSYVNFYGKDSDEDDIRLFNDLIKNGHMSPTEHQCTLMLEDKFYGNIRGFKQYRKFIPNESGE